MAFRIKLNDISVETDSVSELSQAIEVLSRAKPSLNVPLFRKEGAQPLLELSKKPKVEEKRQIRKRRVMSGWTNEHFKFLVDNIEDRDALTALPFKKKDVTRIRWAFRNNRPQDLPALGKKALEEYNKSKAVIEVMEYLPRL